MTLVNYCRKQFILTPNMTKPKNMLPYLQDKTVKYNL